MIKNYIVVVDDFDFFGTESHVVPVALELTIVAEITLDS